MLTYRNVRMVFYAALTLVLLICWVHGWKLIFLIPALILIYLCFIAWGCYFIDSGFFLKALCKGSGYHREIAITFDDGPDQRVTPEVLNLLKKYQVPATFFCIGNKISGNEELIKRIREEGHIIGNHSWSHSYFFDLYRDRRVEEEIRKTTEAVRKITGQEIKYFRPPFGVTNPVIARVVHKLGIPVIGWSIRSYDTTIKNQNMLFERVTRRLRGGDIVLFHDSLPRIIPVLKKFLEHCREKELTIVSLEQLTRNRPGASEKITGP